MRRIYDQNYFLNKLLKDRKINNLISNQSRKDNLSFFENLQEIRRVLHIKDQTDKRILDEFDELIIIPTGTEETLIRELHIFNKEMYNDFPDFYTLDFENIKKDKYNKKISTPKNILNLSNPYIQDYSSDLERTTDLWEKTALDPLNDITIRDLEENLTNEYFGEDKSLVSKLLEKDEIEPYLTNQKEIIVNDEEEKEVIISNIKNILNSGHYKKLNLKKPITISCARYMKKLEALKTGFEKTYGSELFKKIKNWIQEENALYSNIDRINKIEALKKKKSKL
ncbi:hypothetical protein [Spiroplasma taiwanense]|uniref:Uncharacterized protein n=1 Tax=Spiroplasma taiwanense CT-1 TaxID=1276220 RepID=S5LZT5_9MOLU|nr:hypothetical protein [Spiroplasma taiwanense]AGR41222.1 hypothetical protein STAIW_v1c06000 [Spiroplasma taiwanense CT-1]